MVYRNVFFEAANYMALTLSENNIETSHTIIKMLNEYIPYTVVPDMLEGLKEQSCFQHLPLSMMPVYRWAFQKIQTKTIQTQMESRIGR